MYNYMKCVGMQEVTNGNHTWTPVTSQETKVLMQS